MPNKIVIQLEAASLAEAAMNMIDGTDTALLMRILSDRLDAQGRVLMIHDKDVEPSPKSPPPANDKAVTDKVVTNKKAAEKKAVARAEAVAAAKEAATAEDDFADDAVEEGADAQEVVEGTANKLTIVDVRAALDKFRTDHGLVTARTIMQEVGGSSKLVEIDASKYATLLAALAKHTQPVA